MKEDIDHANLWFFNFGFFFNFLTLDFFLTDSIESIDIHQKPLFDLEIGSFQ